MTLNNIGSPVIPANTVDKPAIQPQSKTEDVTFDTSDLSFINDPEYAKAQKDLINLKRVEKGLKDPSQMDSDIKGRVDILSRQRTDKTYFRLCACGFLPGLVSIAGVLLLGATPVGAAVGVGMMALGLVGGNGYILPKFIEPRLMEKYRNDVMKEARADIDSELAKSEASLREIKEKAIERAKNRKEQQGAETDANPAIADEDDCIVIGGIKLSKHVDESQKGGLMHFLTDPFRFRATTGRES